MHRAPRLERGHENQPSLAVFEKLLQLDVPQSYVSKYESGERRLDFVQTALVCETLGMSIEDFAAAYSDRLVKARRTKGG